MITRLHLTTILLVAVVLWCGLLIIQGVAVEAAWLKPFSMVIGALLLLLLAFDKFIWRWRFLHGWFVKRPDLVGTWKVLLKSEWIDQKTGQPPPPITAYLVIRQTFSSLSLRMYSSESSSEVHGTDVVESSDGTYRVYSVYRNEPNVSVRSRSPIHYGGLILNVEGDPAECLTGHYWTDRNSCGTVETVGFQKQITSNYNKAAALFNAKAGEV